MIDPLPFRQKNHLDLRLPPQEVRRLGSLQEAHLQVARQVLHHSPLRLSKRQHVNPETMLGPPVERLE